MESYTRLSLSTAVLSKTFYFHSFFLLLSPTTPALPKQRRFGLFRFRSPLLTESLSCFLLLWVLRCFSSPRSPPSKGMTGLQPAGLPHSDIAGSIVICTSPALFAAYHVLLRLREPRHPPSALVLLSSFRFTFASLSYILLHKILLRRKWIDIFLALLYSLLLSCYLKFLLLSIMSKIFLLHY